MLRILSSIIVSCGSKFGLNSRVHSSVYSLLKGGSIAMLMVWSGWSGWDQGIPSVSRSFTAFVFGSGGPRGVVEVLVQGSSRDLKCFFTCWTRLVCSMWLPCFWRSCFMRVNSTGLIGRLIRQMIAVDIYYQLQNL